MNKIKLKFQYCYGIKKLEKEFILSNRTFTIYAPNGSMKTSFAKTFDDYSKRLDTKDLAFPEREIKVDEQDINPESIFVIEPYNDDYESEKISTLLVNKDLKKNYDEIHKDIDKSKNELIKKLKQLSGLTGRKDYIEEVLKNIFGKDFFDLILEIEDFVSKNGSLPFYDTQYQIIFNDKVISFLNTKDFKNTFKIAKKYHADATSLNFAE